MLNETEFALCVWLVALAVYAQMVVMYVSGLRPSLALQPDEQDVFCSGCGARNQGNPCAACARRPGGA